MKEKFIPAFDFPFLTKSFDSFISFIIPETRIKGELIDFMNIKVGEKMAKGKGGKPSTTGKPSGKGRDNNPPK